jgi:glycogen operon protein
MIWLNAGADPAEVVVPLNEWHQTAEVVLSTDADLPVGTPITAGQRLVLGARTVVVMRQT